LAAELTGGATTESERIAAIAGHVQSGLAYRAIAFGPRALIPTPADQIVQTAFGDCKDHSLLMHLLLKAAGVESYLTLVRFPGDIHPGVPSLDQFNHMILMVPALGDRFIDATDKHTSIMLPVPYGLGGQTALVLDPQQPRLVPIPPFPPDS